MRLNLAILLIGLTLAGCTGSSDQPAPDPEVKDDTALQGDAALTDEATLHVYLIRHAEAYSNIRGADMRAADGDMLTTKGFEQASTLGEFLKDKEIAAVVSSPANRACQTSETIAKALGLEDGYAEDEAFFSAQPGDTMAMSGERAGAGIDRLAKEYSGKAVVVVSHSEICAPLLALAAGTPMEQAYQKHKVENGTYSELVVAGAEWSMLSQNLYPDK